MEQIITEYLLSLTDIVEFDMQRYITYVEQATRKNIENAAFVHFISRYRFKKGFYLKCVKKIIKEIK